jgi:hypothetical protein
VTVFRMVQCTYQQAGKIETGLELSRNREGVNINLFPFI